MGIQALIPESAETTTQTNTGAEMESTVQRILSQFEKADIAYCVLRNRERIPSGLLEWDDLDLMVADKVPLRELVGLVANFEPIQIAPIRAGFTALFFPVADLVL